jgi:hypothetical protein
MGTRWMCTMESPIHHSVKEEIVRMDENSTILVLRKFRNSTRLAKVPHLGLIDPLAMDVTLTSRRTKFPSKWPRSRTPS